MFICRLIGRYATMLGIANATSLGIASIVLSVALATTYFESLWGLVRVLDFVRSLCIYGMLYAAFFLVNRKPVTSALGAAILMVSLGFLSDLKYSLTMMTLHVADLYYFATAPSELSFFFQHYAHFALIGIGCILLAVTALVMSSRAERRSSNLRPAVAVLAFCTMISIALPWLRSSDRAYRHFFDAFHMTSLFTSIPDLGDFITGARLPYEVGLERCHQGAPPPLTRLETSVFSSKNDTAEQNQFSKRPNIIVVLHESTVDPVLYRSEPIYTVPRALFESGDRVSRKLIVETWGGGTWLSEYGLHLGVSTHYFGNLRPYLGYLLDGKIRHSFPLFLKSLGYHSTAIYPAPRRFANTERFYKSLGFDEMLDSVDIAQPSYRERDSFYYNIILEQLRSRRSRDDARPSLYFLWTTATHGPYTTPIHPTSRSNEIILGDEWAEYARRLRLSADDLEMFKADLKSQFTDESFLIVGFGDHQPFLTKSFFPRRVIRGEAADEEIKNSGAFDSFFRLDGINFSPNYNAIPPAIEIAYLSTIITQAAKLPLDERLELRSAMMRRCSGMMFRCNDQRAVAAFHNQLVNWGDLPGPEIRSTEPAAPEPLVPCKGKAQSLSANGTLALAHPQGHYEYASAGGT